MLKRVTLITFALTWALAATSDAQPVLPEKGKTAATVYGLFLSNSDGDGPGYGAALSILGRVDLGVEYSDLSFDEFQQLNIADETMTLRGAIRVTKGLGPIPVGLSASGFYQTVKKGESGQGLFDGARDKSYGGGLWVHKTLSLPVILGVIARAGVEFTRAERSRESILGFDGSFHRNSLSYTVSGTVLYTLHPQGQLYLSPGMTFSEDLSTYEGDKTLIRVAGGYILTLPI